MQGSAIRTMLEGLVGTALRIQGTDTASALLPQGANVWLRAMKEIISGQAEGADWRLSATVLASDNDSVNVSDVSGNATDGGETVYGIIARNNDSELGQFQLHQEAAASVTWGTDETEVVNLVVPARNAANDPGYRFALFPEGMRFTAQAGYPTPGQLSVNIGGGPTLATTVVDGTVWLVYTN